jgi:hypothetical protein
MLAVGRAAWSCGCRLSVRLQSPSEGTTSAAAAPTRPSRRRQATLPASATLKGGAAPAGAVAAQTGWRRGGAREPTQPSRPAAAGQRRRCRATTDRRIATAAAGLSSSVPSVGAGRLRSSRRSARTRSSRGLAGSTICSAIHGRVVNPDSPVGAPAAVRPITAPRITAPSSTASANAALVGRVGRMVTMLASTLPIGRRQSIAPHGRVTRRRQVTPPATRPVSDPRPRQPLAGRSVGCLPTTTVRYSVGSGRSEVVRFARLIHAARPHTSPRGHRGWRPDHLPAWRCSVSKGMWSPTAVRPSAPPWGRQPSCENAGQDGMKASRPRTRYISSLIGMIQVCRDQESE